MPSSLSQEGKTFIQGLLQVSPEQRTPVQKLLSQPYFHPSLPITLLDPREPKSSSTIVSYSLPSLPRLVPPSLPVPVSRDLLTPTPKQRLRSRSSELAPVIAASNKENSKPAVTPASIRVRRHVPVERSVYSEEQPSQLRRRTESGPGLIGEKIKIGGMAPGSPRIGSSRVLREVQSSTLRNETSSSTVRVKQSMRSKTHLAPSAATLMEAPSPFHVHTPRGNMEPAGTSSLKRKVSFSYDQTSASKVISTSPKTRKNIDALPVASTTNLRDITSSLQKDTQNRQESGAFRGSSSPPRLRLRPRSQTFQAPSSKVSSLVQPVRSKHDHPSDPSFNLKPILNAPKDSPSKSRYTHNHIRSFSDNQHTLHQLPTPLIIQTPHSLNSKKSVLAIVPPKNPPRQLTPLSYFTTPTINTGGTGASDQTDAQYLEPPAPFSTVGIPTKLHETRHGTLEFLRNNGGVVIDLRLSERKAGKPRGSDEVLRIGADGENVCPPVLSFSLT